MERMLEATITMICTDTVNTTELRSAARKLGLCRMLRKFSSPTKWKPIVPMRASLNAYRTARSSGTPISRADVSDRRQKHEHTDFAIVYCHGKGLGGIRLPVFASKNRSSCSGTAKS